MNSIDVSFITVNFNGLKDTVELLSSIENLGQVSFTYEVIVVDNGSEDNPKFQILSEFPATKVIVSKNNLGFAGGNNLGINVAKGGYLFFINNDTIVSKGLVELMLNRFKENHKLGMLSPKIKYFGTDVIQYAGFAPLNIFSRNFAYGNGMNDGNKFLNYLPTYSGHGAAMMVSRKVIDEVGCMPEVYFLYYEELDWSQQITRSGYEVMVEQRAEIHHKESMSVGKNSAFKIYYMHRNRILFVKRNFKGIRRLIGLMYLYLLVTPLKLLEAFINNKNEHFKSYYKAMVWNIKAFQDE